MGKQIMLLTNSLQRIFLLGFAFLLFTTQTFSQENELEKLLRLDIEDLTGITVITATKSPTNINEVPATVKVITSEIIKENGYLTLEDALSTLPGFQFRNILGFNSYVFQRGLPNQNNLALLLVDGIQINELNSGGFYAGGQFNLDNVKRIEVIYGPASALYGTNAISGVINIITKDPEDNRGFSISGLYGSFKTYNGNAAYGYYDEKEEFGFRIAGMVKSSQKADLAGSEGDYNWYSNMENYEDDYSIDLKSQYRNLKFGFTFQNKQSSRTTNYKSTGTNYLDRNTLWNISFVNSYLKYYRKFSSNLDLLATLYYRNSTILDNTVAYITDTSQVAYYRPNNLTGIESMFSYSPLQDLKLIGGVVFEYESLANDYSITYSNSSSEKPPAPKAPMMDNNTLLSLYLQAQYKISGSFNLYGGARFDHSSVYEDIVTPRFGLVFNENKFTVKLLYSEAFRAPKPWDYTFGLGNADLKPEKMRSIELATQYSLSQHFNIDLSIYKNKLSDLITTETINNNSKNINSGDVSTTGLEINLDYKGKSVRSFLNYTYNSSIDNNRATIPEIAKHSANIGITYYPSEDAVLSLRCSYLGERKNPKIISSTGKDYIDNAVVVYTTWSYTGLEKFRISLIVNNLLNQTYYDTSNRPPDRYRQQQRAILLRAEYNL
jgi:outer membrane receptor for ferrienterochelin and colicins